MSSLARLSSVLLPLLVATHAIPTPGMPRGYRLVQRQSQSDVIAPISAAQEASFKPFTFFASAAYCNSSVTSNWSCGSTHLVLLLKTKTHTLAQKIAMQMQVSFQQRRVEMAQTCSSVCLAHPHLSDSRIKAKFLFRVCWLRSEPEHRRRGPPGYQSGVLVSYLLFTKVSRPTPL